MSLQICHFLTEVRCLQPFLCAFPPGWQLRSSGGAFAIFALFGLAVASVKLISERPCAWLWFYIICSLQGLPQPAGCSGLRGPKEICCHTGIACRLSNLYPVVAVAFLLLLRFPGHRKLIYFNAINNRIGIHRKFTQVGVPVPTWPEVYHTQDVQRDVGSCDGVYVKNKEAISLVCIISFPF